MSIWSLAMKYSGIFDKPFWLKLLPIFPTAYIGLGLWFGVDSVIRFACHFRDKASKEAISKVNTVTESSLELAEKIFAKLKLGNSENEVVVIKKYIKKPSVSPISRRIVTRSKTKSGRGIRKKRIINY